MVSCDQGLHLLLWAAVVECFFPTMHSDSLAPNISYEIIIPRRLEPEAGEAKKAELSYIIKVAGKEHIIRLREKNHFLVANLPVFTYESGGQRVKSHPYIPSDCYYRGYVEGVADSLVALSTCFGLRGFLQIRDRNYGLEPLSGSQTFQHLLYLPNKTSLGSTMGGPKAKDTNRQADEAGRGKANARFVDDPLYIELYAVVDFWMCFFLRRNETLVMHTVVDIINSMYTHYRSLNIVIVLVGLDIWKGGDPIAFSTDSKKVLEDFSKWERAHAKEVGRDFTHLFSGVPRVLEPPESYRGGICKRNLSVWLVQYSSWWKAPEMSLHVSHALGHNLGLDHDGPNCFCDGQTNCIMHATETIFPGFSDCSVASLSRLATRSDVDCLRNFPTSFFKVKQCGDKVLDAGEQCDCGNREECEWNPCCHPNCTLKAKAVCANGDCCQNCQFTPEGTLCRPSVNPCDLPEYCNGTSMLCPADVHVQDGTPCDMEAYCYAKQCSTHRLHCADIFGKEASAAPLSCFRALNMAGDQVGNCGADREGRNFVKCKEKDILCGRLYCSNVKKKLNPLRFTESLVNGVSCWSTKYQSGRGPRDAGAVPDGTTCGKEKICMNRTCVPVFILKSDCDPAEKCQGRGVCNNRKNCHCDLGWAPPDCKHAGVGGSIDSGPPRQAYTSHMTSLAFRVFIPVLLAVFVVSYCLFRRTRWLLRRCRRRESHVGTE